jgi:hypothetical protein
LFDTSHKTDAHDAVAVVAHTNGRRVLAYDERREALSRARLQTVNGLQRLLAELTPGRLKKYINPLQAKAILSGVRAGDLVGKTCKTVAVEQLADTRWTRRSRPRPSS